MVKVHYINPFDINRNYGDNINNAIKQLNLSDDEDWICLRDLDVAFLTPDAGRLIHDAFEKYGKEYSLIGCVTNRLGSANQAAFSFEEMDMSVHYNNAVTAKNGWGFEVKQFTNDIAGMFMLFSVKIWRKTGGFKNSIVFDREFTKAVRMNGGKVGIMPGLYVLHCYRLWAPTRQEAKNSVSHLIK